MVLGVIVAVLVVIVVQNYTSLIETVFLIKLVMVIAAVMNE